MTTDPRARRIARLAEELAARCGCRRADIHRPLARLQVELAEEGHQ